MSNSEAAAVRKTKTKEAMKALIDSTNVMSGEEDMIEGMFEALLESHRTLQQSFFRVLIGAMEDYSQIDTDLRNEASVKFAKDVGELQPHFPFI